VHIVILSVIALPHGLLLFAVLCVTSSLGRDFDGIQNVPRGLEDVSRAWYVSANLSIYVYF